MVSSGEASIELCSPRRGRRSAHLTRRCYYAVRARIEDAFEYREMTRVKGFCTAACLQLSHGELSRVVCDFSLTVLHEHVLFSVRHKDA
jgi:hypothetical protein